MCLSECHQSKNRIKELQTWKLDRKEKIRELMEPYQCRRLKARRTILKHVRDIRSWKGKKLIQMFQFHQ
jgi:hypothetical protein